MKYKKKISRKCLTFFIIKNFIYNYMILGTNGSANNQLRTPRGVTRDDSTGIIFVTDTGNHRIMKYEVGSLNGILIAGGQGPGTNVTQLNSPRGICYDSLSNSLFITNYGANNIIRWKLGDTQWTLIAGSINGVTGSTSTTLRFPTDFMFDILGNMYVADSHNHRIQFFLPNQFNGTTILGITGISGSNNSLLNFPFSIVFDSQLNMYVADVDNHRVQKFIRY